MAPRRGTSSSNTLSPRDRSASSSSQSTPAFPLFPRSASPSSGFTQFLSKPSKWFSRSVSSPRLASGSAEPRVSTASTSSGRKHKISRPTDPRPILASFNSEAYIGSSRSVLDLSLSRPQASLDIAAHAPGSPSSLNFPIGGQGDLRNVSRRAWSKSVDDLGKISTSSLPPINTSFQSKVEQYRNRTNSNASGSSSTPLSASPTVMMNSRQPFPTITSPSPMLTSSPLSSSPPQNPSISISAPAVEDKPSPNSTHVHTRSYSFTPRLPSKLSTPRFGPPSPSKKGSGSSERDFEFAREGNKSGSLGSGSSPRGAFPFGFSAGPSSKSLPPDPSPQLLAPTIVEPGLDGEADAGRKRSSQIVHHSGFINRLPDMPPALVQRSSGYFHHTNTSLSKGWKQFKLEVKGSKLYFYKPPGDRAAAVKDLFPVDFVAAMEDDELDGELDELEGANGPARKEREDGTVGRKKRAFWGRKTHPDLVRGSGPRRIESGGFDALVHETVFATTFSDTHPPSNVDPADVDKRKEEWQVFASAILLCLPSLVGQPQFENEFIRCCAYLVSGAEENAKHDILARVGWLADEYVRCHGAPADVAAWEEWKAETIPDIQSAVVHRTNAPTIPNSSSVQGLYVPSPLLGHGSPTMGAFSPRPESNDKMVSLMHALGSTPPPPRNSSLDFRSREQPPQAGPSLSASVPWVRLEQEGLSRNVLLTLDPFLVARSLSFFHRGVFERTPESIMADFVIGPDLASNSGPITADATASFAPLFGSEDHPHWLTKLLLMQILGTDTSAGSAALSPSPSSPARAFDERNAQTSRTHSRSEVISAWAKIAELCRLDGDECSWRAIAAALCSRPVARLDKAWKRVDSAALVAVESWVYAGADGECLGINEPRKTPWGGDLKSRVKEELVKARDDGGDERFKVAPLEKARKMFESLRTSFSLCPRKASGVDGAGEDMRKMMSFWRDMAAEGGGTGSMASKFLRIDQFMSLSLAAEPRRKGLFEPYYWARASSWQTSRSALVPLLFPEPLPSLTLIDRGPLLRGRLDAEPHDLRLRGIETLEHGADASTSKGFVLGGMNHGGTVIPVYNGELLLVVQTGGDSTPASKASSRAPSRPPSSVVDAPIPEKTLTRAPSIRVKPGSSQGLDRRPSTARRNSLPSISQRQSFTTTEPSSGPPLRVIVQAGTLSCLVNILVYGLQNVSVSVADDNGEMSLREGKTRDLVVDQVDFAKVWWNSFRSFVTPLVFFELLRKLYLNSQLQTSSPSVAEYISLIAARSEVLGTIKEWFCAGGGAQDALDDTPLFNAVQSFLDDASSHGMVATSNFQDVNVRHSWRTLQQTISSLALSFHAQTKRPTRIGHCVRPSPVRSNSRTSSREAPDIDFISAEHLVDNLDGMASAAFTNVSEEDLFVTADLLEVQTADRAGWLRDVVWADDAVEIQTLHSYIREIRPSFMISELAQDSLYRLLPPGVRTCIRAYGILRRWLVSKLVAPRLGIRTRQTRMELYIQAIEIARLRSSEPGCSPLSVVDRPCIRSFAEAVLTSAVISVESRIHNKAWQAVALGRGVQCDALASLLCRRPVPEITSRELLTVDIGWLLERMLEIITTPDAVESSSDSAQGLVNFDKRRHLCNLVTNAPSLASLHRSRRHDESDRRSFERLNNIEKEVNLLQFNHRGIKDEAQREGMQASINVTGSAKKVVRPFQKVVTSQIEKNRRDKKLHDRSIQDERLEHERHMEREDFLNKAMRPRKPNATVSKQHRNKKSMSSAFMHFMRPISSAFTSETLRPSGPKRTASELDFVPSGKPSLVLSLVDAKVAQFINNERSFTFQLDTEDGGHYLLQATSKRDMGKWMDTINRITAMAAKRRLTYLGNSPKPQLSDHIHSRPITASRDPAAVFGVDLHFLLQREAGNHAVQPGAIPSVIEYCLGEIEARGLSEVGIYRIAGATSEINALKDAFNTGGSPIQSSTDIHAVCDLVKSWFRVLPEPVFPSSSYHDIIEAMKLENFDARLSKIRDVVQDLPQANFDLLRRVAEHLDKVTDYEEHNQMTAEALAIVFSPNLLRAPQNDFVMILANMAHTHRLVKALITHFHVIFDDVDHDAEVDQEEDEYDSAILEENEDEVENEDIPPPINGHHVP